MIIDDRSQGFKITNSRRRTKCPIEIRSDRKSLFFSAPLNTYKECNGDGEKEDKNNEAAKIRMQSSSGTDHEVTRNVCMLDFRWMMRLPGLRM